MPEEIRHCRYCKPFVPAVYEIEFTPIASSWSVATPVLHYVCGAHLAAETIAAITRDPRHQIVTTKIGD